jgi:hypothetical protein
LNLYLLLNSNENLFSLLLKADPLLNTQEWCVDFCAVFSFSRRQHFPVEVLACFFLIILAVAAWTSSFITVLVRNSLSAVSFSGLYGNIYHCLQVPKVDLLHKVLWSLIRNVG